MFKPPLVTRDFRQVVDRHTSIVSNAVSYENSWVPQLVAVIAIVVVV